ncbi:hypothetical protein DFH08DRAFT_964974 [Mycena albidolilacea]|uniref:Uncharacterized protein n=1 Tax=Mycena albidolilacea TaxID=1033008 RepID=A0AAD7EMZ0_9AGAR|nr:hypothetical protein DFH08DRAFT_964974 [Mycena albidolilacea]
MPTHIHISASPAATFTLLFIQPNPAAWSLVQRTGIADIQVWLLSQAAGGPIHGVTCLPNATLPPIHSCSFSARTALFLPANIIARFVLQITNSAMTSSAFSATVPLLKLCSSASRRLVSKSYHHFHDKTNESHFAPLVHRIDGHPTRGTRCLIEFRNLRELAIKTAFCSAPSPSMRRYPPDLVFSFQYCDLLVDSPAFSHDSIGLVSTTSTKTLSTRPQIFVPDNLSKERART